MYSHSLDSPHEYSAQYSFIHRDMKFMTSCQLAGTWSIILETLSASSILWGHRYILINVRIHT